ncbi:MAG TPA: hypothetical protein VNM24_11115 [Burkholderiales bacterium]|jgi:hypothetical protein|nr:hypothetical protein [Burkholderiales bacterium]
MKRALPVCVLLAGALCGPVLGEKQPALEDTRAIYALNLFGAACMANLGDADRISAWAGLEALAPLDPGEVALLLAGKPGHGWNASGPNGEALLLLGEDGVCSVWARRAAAAQTQAWVRAMMQQAGADGTRAELVEDRLLDGRGGQYRLVAFRLSSTGSPRQFLLSCATTEADNEQVAAQLMLSVGEIRPR